ncbi:hypothetical protein [Mesorhizobium sp.]|uniref:hypothetical protein n=1 Tax=Mesorhizobium sp. TaxID=1871066 RepID=UPI000FE7C0FA|nr:hypothetical protein [Mesorhizobium sp.]RWK57559.1 MAG: hypothetical protein EOR49_33840 [Mesorhizobium sp.]RWM42179.1 MAG: hypothetical protein EOR76_33495 [Mesorhizobium sp.]
MVTSYDTVGLSLARDNAISKRCSSFEHTTNRVLGVALRKDILFLDNDDDDGTADIVRTKPPDKDANIPQTKVPLSP